MADEDEIPVFTLKQQAWIENLLEKWAVRRGVLFEVPTSSSTKSASGGSEGMLTIIILAS